MALGQCSLTKHRSPGQARRFVPGFGTLQTRKVASVQTILNGRSLPGSKHARVAGFWLQTPAAEPFHHKVNPDPPLLPGEPRVGRDPQDQGNAAADAGAAAAGTWMPCTMYTFSASLSVTDAMLPSSRLRHRPASLPRRPRPPPPRVRHQPEPRPLLQPPPPPLPGARWASPARRPVSGRVQGAAAPRCGEPSLQPEAGSRLGDCTGRRRRLRREPQQGPGTGEVPPTSRSVGRENWG